MVGVMEKILNEKMLDLAKKMLRKGKVSFEEIAEYCELPLEKVQELAASISPQIKEQT